MEPLVQEETPVILTTLDGMTGDGIAILKLLIAREAIELSILVAHLNISAIQLEIVEGLIGDVRQKIYAKISSSSQRSIDVADHSCHARGEKDVALH